jgi:hypothetical protein
MLAIFPVGQLGAGQPQIELPDQRGGLESVIRPLTAHAGAGYKPQAVVSQWQQLAKGLVAPIAPLAQ